MNVIIVVIFIVVFVIVTGLSTYYILKEDENVTISKKILDCVEYENEDDLDKLIEFSKSNNFKYKI